MLTALSPVPSEEPTVPDLPELADDEFELVDEPHTESYVGKLPQRPFDPAEAARSRHEELAKVTDEIELRCAGLSSYDLSGRAAQSHLRERARLLGLVCDGLDHVVVVATSTGTLEGPLAPYLAGSYLWLDAVAASLLTLSDQLDVMQPDWAALRESLAEVAWLYEMTLTERARIERTRPFAGTALEGPLSYVFSGLSRFKASLDQPFG